MKTKSKTFARKLVALFLAAIMAISCFMGTVTAFAKSTDDYHDSNLAYNFMTWAEATDNQTCEALLDWVDLYIGDLMTGLMGTDHIFFEQNVVVTTIKIDAYLDSVDGIIDLISQANGLLKDFGGIIGGDVKNINLSPLPSLGSVTQGSAVISKCGKSYRAVNDAKAIVLALAKTLYINSNDNDGNKNVIGNFVKGKLNLGSIIEGALGGNVYSLLQTPLGMWDGYQSNLVYNIVANLILTKTNWYTESEVSAYQAYLKNNSTGKAWNFDNELLDKLSTELLQNINADITYDVARNVQEEGTATEGGIANILTVTDDSRAHYEKIKAKMKSDGMTFKEASNALGYDPNLHYTDSGNVYLFRYGYEADGVTPSLVFTIDKNTTLVEAGFDALELAWHTALKDTINLLHVNYNNWENDQKGLGTNFDNEFYYWRHNKGEWNENDWTANYTDANVKAWAADVAADYGYTDSTAVEDFLAQVRKDLDLDRIVDPEAGENANWRNIDATRLFMKLRYSPLADKYFNMQTGPINLYLAQTGYSHLEEFMSTAFDTYDGIVAALNDALVAIVYDLFPQSNNIGIQNADGSTTSLSVPTLRPTGNTFDIGTITSTLVANTLDVIEYTANATDANILNPYYTKHNISTVSGNLTETNIEEALVPMIIACLIQIDMLDPVHPEAWDKAKDAEGIAYLALREYLSYVLPDKDYDQLVTTADGSYKAGIDLNHDGEMDLYTDVILPMARDAVGYLLNSIVPCRKPNGEEWNVYQSDLLTDDTTIFEILNSVICYYGSTETFREPDGTTSKGKGVGALLGCVDGSGNCLIKMNNSLWQNINVIANNLLPVCGTLQYGTSASAGQSDSKQIIYDTVVMGLLEIGRVNEHTGTYGISSILEQLLTVFTSEPLNKSILITVYDDILASLLNNILGARDTRQRYPKVIPYSTDYSGTAATTPFDSLVQESTIGEFQGGTGVLGVLINNVYEFFAGTATNYGTAAGADGCWQGAMFAVTAVNNFVPSFVPQLSEHSFNAATISLDTPSEKVSSGTARQTVNLKFVNNCRGLNRFYKDKDGTIKRSPRYFVRMKDIAYSLADGSSISNINTKLPDEKIVAPEETSLIPVNGTNVDGTQLVKFTVTYDIFEGEYSSSGALPTPSKILYPDLSATCYLYLTTDKGWVETTFVDTDATSGAMSSGDNIYDSTKFTYTTAGSGETFIFNDMIFSTANTAQLDNFGLYATGIDGLMAVDNNGDAYAVMDAKNGDLLNTGLVDYKLGDADWNRGTTSTVAGVTVYNGFTQNEIQSIATDAKNNGIEFATRQHVALTLSEAGNLVKTVEKDGDKYASITVDKALIKGYAVSASTPTHGISFLDLRNANGSQVKFMKYDGTSSVTPGSYTMRTIAYAAGEESEPIDTNVIFANDEEAITLQRTYNDYIKAMASYQATDYEDYNSEYASSQTNDKLQGAFQTSVEAISKPITLENASSLDSTYVTVAKTNTTDKTYGDVAYKPIPTSETLTGDIAKRAIAYNGYWYLDEAHTLPIYKNVELTANDVTNGKDAAGTSVVYNEDDKKYHVATAPKYKYEWTLKYSEAGKVYPYYAETEVQESVENALGEPILQYLDNQYEYHMADADNTQVTSGDAWEYKFAITEQQIKKNDTNDYRGFYQKQMDNLKYWVEQAKKNIDTSLVSSITEGVIEDRKGKNNVNYEVATYEKMVKIARNAESLLYVEDTITDENGNKVNVYSTTASSVEIREAKRQYDKYADIAEYYARGYKGDKLEAEITCAAGSAYTAFDATVVEDEVTGAVTEATVTRKSNSTTAKYGSYDTTGKLVNLDAETGEKAYSDASWNNYVAELAKSIKMAQAKEAAISAIYTQKSALAIAETSLEAPKAATTFHLSGTVVIADDATGTTGSVGVKAAVYADGTKVGNTDNNGVINLDIDLGVTKITFKAISGESKFADRTATVAGDADITGAVVPVNAFDLNNDNKVNSTDAVIYCNAPFDINGDAKPDSTDGGILKSVMRSGVSFGSLVLK